MRIITLISVYILISNLSFGCFSASQNRIFPIGENKSGLCVLEVQMSRTEYEIDNSNSRWENMGWFGISYYKIYDSNYNVLYSLEIDTIKLFPQNEYDSIINVSFIKAQKIAKKSTGFKEATPLNLSFSDYQDTSKSTTLVFDTIQNKVGVKLNNCTYYDLTPVILDSNSIASIIYNYITNFSAIEVSSTTLKRKLFIGSIRRYQIGNKKLLIIHIGSGQNLNFPSQTVDNSSNHKYNILEFSDINKTIFIEPVLFHGVGFDYFTWEK